MNVVRIFFADFAAVLFPLTFLNRGVQNNLQENHRHIPQTFTNKSRTHVYRSSKARVSGFACRPGWRLKRGHLKMCFRGAVSMAMNFLALFASKPTFSCAVPSNCPEVFARTFAWTLPFPCLLVSKCCYSDDLAGLLEAPKPRKKQSRREISRK